MSDLDTTAPIARARQLFDREQLPFPPLPDALATHLEDTDNSEFVFSTRPLDYGPYHLELFRDEVLAGTAVADYAILGFDGHGVNSWAVHYFVVQPGLALFLQGAWGGAYDDPNTHRQTITQLFRWAAGMQNAMARAVSTGKVATNQRLVVVYSALIASGWGWIPAPSNDSTQSHWHETPEVLNDSANALLTLLNGNPAP